MKTLKEELQEIVRDKKLAFQPRRFHICILLSDRNRNEFIKYFEMSKKYAPRIHTKDPDSCFGWWRIKNDNYRRTVSEKYRFIQDLIKILP